MNAARVSPDRAYAAPVEARRDDDPQKAASVSSRKPSTSHVWSGAC